MKKPGRPDEIRVALTPSISENPVLLPEEDTLRSELSALASFLAGVRYYSLDDRPDAKDLVPAQFYEDWAAKYQNEGELTDSVAVRLIYMYYQDRPLYDEFTSLVGPDGLGLIENIEIFDLERSFGNGASQSRS